MLQGWITDIFMFWRFYCCHVIELLFTNCEDIADAMRLNHCHLLCGCVDWVILTTVELVVILKNFLSVGHVEDMQVCLFVWK